MAFDPTSVGSVVDNANTYADFVDQEFATADIKDGDGNAVTLSRVAGSPTWLMALAQGNIMTEWQERCRRAYYALDPANCTDDQVRNLAQLAGIVTHVNSTPYVVVDITNTNNFSIYLTSDNCYATDSVFGYKWYLGQGLNLAPNATFTVNLYCSKDNISVPADTSFTITSVSDAFPPISTATAVDSQIDLEAISIEELRNTLQLAYQHLDIVSQCQQAIEQLNGITKCSIFFNSNADDPITLPGGVELPGRTAFVAIQGADVDQLLAQTYFKFMNVQTVETQNTLDSTYQLGASLMHVYYEQVAAQTCYIKVLIKSGSAGTDTTYQQRIKDTLLAHSGSLAIGDNITAQMANTWLANLSQYVTILDVELSMDGTNYSNTTAVDANKYLTFTAANIIFA